MALFHTEGWIKIYTTHDLSQTGKKYAKFSMEVENPFLVNRKRTDHKTLPTSHKPYSHSLKHKKSQI